MGGVTMKMHGSWLMVLIYFCKTKKQKTPAVQLILSPGRRLLWIQAAVAPPLQHFFLLLLLLLLLLCDSFGVTGVTHWCDSVV